MEHFHLENTKRLFLASLLLLGVFAIEIVGFKSTGSLILLAHIAEIASDTFGFLVLLLVSLYALRNDQKGRVHRKNHPEENFAAVVNLTIMGFGVLYAFIKAILGLFNPEPVVGLLAVVGPSVSVFIYLAINVVLTSKEENVGLGTLRAHLLGDITASVVVTLTSTVALLVGTSWINPIGAVIICILLAGILFKQIDNYIINTSLNF